MTRLFAYGRVSTTEQNTENQLNEITRRGFDVRSTRWHSEKVSAGVPALQRPIFSELLKKLEAGDTLVVAKLDRLGRDVVDVVSTIECLTTLGVKVLSLDLEGVDLTSAAGKLQLNVLAAVAQFEKQRLRERTLEGLARSTKKAGRPVANDTTRDVQNCKAKGLSQTKTATELTISIATVKRHWNTTLELPKTKLRTRIETTHHN